MYIPSNLTADQWPAYKAAAAQPDRAWALQMNVKLKNGTVLNLSESDIVANSLVFQEQSTCSDGIMVGSTFCNSLDFTLVNDDGRFRQYDLTDGRVTVTVKLYISDLDKWAEVKLGTFCILEAGKKYTTIPVKCMDLMYKFNCPLEKAEPIFPISLRLLFQKVCLLLGISFTSGLDLLLPDLTLNAFDTAEFTCRDFLANLGCLIGKNFRMSRNNELEAFWYTDGGCITTPDTRIDITLNDLQVHPTAVSVKDWAGNAYLAEDAEESYLIAFDTNPLIQTEETAAAVLDRLTLLLTAVQYRPYTCNFSGDPAVQAGDTVIHQTISEEQQAEKNLESLIMLHEYRFRGTGKIAALGKTAEQDNQRSAEAKKILDVQIQAEKNLKEGLSFAQRALLNQSKLFGESMALYCGTKLDAQGRLVGFYLASEPIFPESGTFTSDDEVKDTECYVWAYGSSFGVSGTGYKGPYAGITKDQSILAKIITADWIRTGVLSAVDDTLRIDLESGMQTLTAKEGWGQTVLDGIGALFTYWNKNVTNTEEDGYPKLAFLQISADANEQADTDTHIAADLKLTWSAETGNMRTTVGHTIVHAVDGTAVESCSPFEIKSTAPIHVSPSLYFDEALLFDNIIMRRSNYVPGNTGVDFLIAPNSVPETPFIPIPDGQTNMMPNPGFEENLLSPWVKKTGNWHVVKSSYLVHGGTYSAIGNDGGTHICALTAAVMEQMGFYDHPVYFGFWYISNEEDSELTNMPLQLRSGDSPETTETTYLELRSDGTAWKYASIIFPRLEENQVISLWSTGDFAYAVDDFHVYDAQGYTLAQWDDYVTRGAN